ncbi:MAG TPA: DUF4082 domain-containing protein [Microlunatus sp.]
MALMVGILVAPPPAEAAPGDVTLFDAAIPSMASDPDTSPVELGVSVIPRVNGRVSGIRFYKGSANTGTHTGSLWAASGTRLATATFTNETASGWQVVTFAAPVAVTAGQRLVASYYAPRGRYAGDERFFNSSYVRGDLTVPANGGVYRYGASGFPTSVYNATNYYVDLVFSPAAVTPSTTPTPTTPTPTPTPTTPTPTPTPTTPTPTPTDTRAPQISAVAVSAVGQSGATISWTTDEPASSQIAYGRTSTYGSTTTLDSSLTTSHSQTLTGLTASTAYRFQVRSTDAVGNTSASTDAGFTTATPSTTPGFNPGNPTGTATVPTGWGVEDVSAPDRVIGTGTPASCTSAAVVAAVTAGGVITFNCGPDPLTITLSQTLKVRNSTRKLVLDGGGKVTLSGGNSNRILYMDTCDTSLGTVSGNCLYAPQWPQVTVQNITFADGNATNATYVSPGDVGQGSNGGGAIFALGGRLKVVRSVFVRNTCATNGPDLGGAAIRVLAQRSSTPNDLDASYAARNQEPVAIVQSTFGGANGQGNKCSNGGAISGLRTPITLLNSQITYNSAIGCCANPAKPGTPGGGSGGAIYTDGGTYDLKIAGSDIQYNTAKAGGSAIFYVSNDRTGRLIIDRSVSKNNTYVPSGQSTPQSFQNYPGIFYLGNGSPVITNSTIQ